MRQRNIGTGRVRRALHGKKHSQGGGVYRVERKGPGGVTTVVVVKRKKGREVILSTWKQRSHR